MKITKDINKLTIELVRAINLTLVNEIPLSLFTSITSTPKRGGLKVKMIITLLKNKNR